MKKLLILMLVLGMASMANAAMQIIDNLDGTVDVQTDIELTTSDYYYMTLVGDTTKVTVSGGQVETSLQALNGTDWDLSIGDDAVGTGYPVVSGMNGIYMTEALYSGTFAADTTLFEGIDWTLVGGTTVTTIYLYRVPGDFSGPGTVESSLVVPEPMTVLLLSLGGLFLRRRR